MQKGKLTSEQLRELVLNHLGKRRPEVKVGAKEGVDCAVFEAAGLLCISTDPVTGKVAHPARLAMQVAFNDVLAANGEPFLALLTLLAPPTASPEEIETAVKEAEEEARALGAEIVGGHTEVTGAITELIVSVTAIGKTKQVRTAIDLTVGDLLYLAGMCGIEGALVLASSEKCRGVLTSSERSELEKMESGTGLKRLPALAWEAGASAMHDVTEGGVFGAVAEICESAGVGVELDVGAIPLHPLALKLAKSVGADVYRLISSGALLIAAHDEKFEERAKEKGLIVRKIGRITDPAEGRYARFPDGQCVALEVRADEMYRLDG